MNSIELRLRDVAQLFNTLDPFPFRERDLSPDAAEYIVDWAQGLPKTEQIKIVVHLQSDALAPGAASDIGSAIKGWFGSRARAESTAIRKLFRDGRLALLIGIAILSACLLLSWYIAQRSYGPFGRVLQESFIIIGWVVMWKPAEIFLYDWLPFVRRRKLYRRLATSEVMVLHAAPAAKTPHPS